MENASKALLIAGAILIAIVLISLGVMILGQGSDLVKNTDMSDAEISTYNSKFEQYLGGNVRGNMVIQMINAVNQHNRSNSSDRSKQIDVVLGTSDAPATAADLTGNAPSVTATSDIKTGYSYKVTAQYSTGNLINKIYLVKKSN